MHIALARSSRNIYYFITNISDDGKRNNAESTVSILSGIAGTGNLRHAANATAVSFQ